MILCPATIQTQLGEAISIIADSDFWERWDTLVQDLVSRLTPADYKVNNGVLEVAHSIFVRWRPLFRSDDLFTEINHVLKTFAEPFIELLFVRRSVLVLKIRSVLLTHIGYTRLPTRRSRPTPATRMRSRDILTR